MCTNAPYLTNWVTILTPTTKLGHTKIVKTGKKRKLYACLELQSIQTPELGLSLRNCCTPCNLGRINRNFSINEWMHNGVTLEVRVRVPNLTICSVSCFAAVIRSSGGKLAWNECLSFGICSGSAVRGKQLCDGHHQNCCCANFSKVNQILVSWLCDEHCTSSWSLVIINGSNGGSVLSSWWCWWLSALVGVWVA